MRAMRRNAAVRPVFVLGRPPAPGTPVIADELRPGTPGPTRCPAAPLLAGSLRRLGVPAGRGLLAYDDECGDHRSLGFLVSWVDGPGTAIGLGAAAHAEEPDALAAAAQVVREWTAVLRPRNLLVLDRPEPVDLLLALDPATLSPCQRRGVPAHLLRSVEELRPEWLAGVGTVGLLVHPDTDRGLLTGVARAIGGLGPTKVVRRTGLVTAKESA
ncbi:hypothetical protein JOF53_008081 [Crossiella equi]|uniref:YcaO domain-containing protein n=1 Tax=Crossiella equi TaxID=130796 RepID=A0ABS5ARL5_9PSEU|nr:hypothetical protein [Crossiella equi]MBP2479209.1 hypothetical protein [Crossiella equi]